LTTIILEKIFASTEPAAKMREIIQYIEQNDNFERVVERNWRAKGATLQNYIPVLIAGVVGGRKVGFVV
jgi:hypothetical protein